jgi:hypothetical protein
MSYQACLLCGVEGPQVRIALVEWLIPIPRRFDSIPRCSDTAGCRARVLAQDEEWPLAPTSDERKSA